jgi:hypothetical protein
VAVKGGHERAQAVFGQPLQTTPILPGQTFTTVISSCAAGFQGYVIIECHFFPARGYGYLIGKHKENFTAPGYLAEVIRRDNVSPEER